MTGGTGADRFAWTGGQTLTTNNARTLAAADTITDFNRGQTDVIAFANALGLAFGANVATFATNFTDGDLFVVNLNGAGTAGAAGAAGNGALVVFNTTGADIDLSAGANTTAALLASTGLQVIQLAGQAGINYGDIVAGDFVFNA